MSTIAGVGQEKASWEREHLGHPSLSSRCTNRDLDRMLIAVILASAVIGMPTSLPTSEAATIHSVAIYQWPPKFT